MRDRSPTRTWALLLTALAFLLVPATAYARANEIVVERAWLEDPGGLLTWEEVRARPMAPVRGLVSLGYSDAPVWLRLRIDPPLDLQGGTDPLFVRIRPMYLDEIVLFDPLQETPERPPVGDRYPVSGQARPATTFLYAVPAGDGPRDLWLRVRTTSTRLVHAEVVTAAEVWRGSAARDHLGGLYLGLIAMFFLWGMVQAVLKAERIMVAFLACQSVALLLGVCQLGYSYLYLPDTWPPSSVDYLTSIAIILVIPSHLVLANYLLEEVRPARWRRRLLLTLCLVYPLLLSAIWAGYVRPAMVVNAALGLLAPILLLALAVAACFSRTNAAQLSTLSKPALLSYFIAMLFFALMTVAPALGIVPAVEFNLYAVLWHGLSSGALMLLMLQYRSLLILQQQNLLRIAAHDAALRAERELVYREDRERLLGMLGHELKTPLATIQMTLADRDVPAGLSSRIGTGVSEMAGILDRIMQAGRVEAGRTTLAPESGDLVEVLRSLCEELPGGGRIRISMCVDATGSYPVRTDLMMLRGVLRNLLENALKYGPPDVSVDVEIIPRDERGVWGLVVANAPGRAGLPDGSRVFEKYYRSPRAGYCSGSGLGLYLVRGMARQMGGNVEYEPEGGKVRFRLTLPDLWEENA